MQAGVFQSLNSSASTGQDIRDAFQKNGMEVPIGLLKMQQVATPIFRKIANDFKNNTGDGAPVRSLVGRVSVIAPSCANASAQPAPASDLSDEPLPNIYEVD